MHFFSIINFSIRTLAHDRKLRFGVNPPVTWTLHLIADLDRKDEKASQALFFHLASSYMTPPFLVWTALSKTM